MTTFKLNELRGLACLLVVMYHAVGSSAAKGMYLPDHHPLRQIVDVLALVRMPMFAIISGYVYAKYPVGDWKDFVGKKMTRLGMPLLAATVIYWAATQDTTPFLEAIGMSYMHLWYLKATLVMLFLVAVCDLCFNGHLVGRALALLIGLLLPATGWLSITGVHYLFPFFFAGMMFYNREHQVLTLAPYLAPFFVALFVADCFTTLSPSSIVIAGITGFVSIATVIPSNKLLGYVGKHSYTIYLWHVVAMGLPRFVLNKIHVDSDGLMLISRVVAGTFLPVSMWHLLSNTPFTMWLFGKERKVKQVRVSQVSEA